MNGQPFMENQDLEKQVQDFARTFHYPDTPNIAQSLPRMGQIQHRQHQQKMVRVMGYALGAAVMLLFSVLVLRQVDWSRGGSTTIDTPTEAALTKNGGEPTFQTVSTLPAYPQELGRPDYVLSYYDDKSYSVILVWQKVPSGRQQNRPPLTNFQQVGFAQMNVPSYVVQQSMLSNNIYFRNPFARVEDETLLYEQILPTGEKLIWQVTRMPYYR